MVGLSLEAVLSWCGSDRVLIL